MVGYLPNGKTDRRTVSGATRKEVQKHLRALQQRFEAGLAGDARAGKETVAVFLRRWLEVIDGTIRPSTLYRYKVIVENHLVPALGQKRLAELRPEHLVDLYAQARKVRADGRTYGTGASGASGPDNKPQGYSPRTVKYLHTTLRKALDLAVKLNAVPRNVARAVDAPKVPRPEIDFMTPLQVRTLLTSATEIGSRFAELWAVAVTTGARSGELRGLKWSDINLERGTVSIVRTLASIKDGVPTFNAPKTTRSRRTVTISGEAVAALRVVQDRQTFERQRLKEAYANTTDLVFTTELGEPLEASNTLHAFTRALKADGLPDKYRVHDLRHAAATLMLLAKVHPKVVSERLGHASVSITLDLYSHVLEGLDGDAADKIEAAIRNAV